MNTAAASVAIFLLTLLVLAFDGACSHTAAAIATAQAQATADAGAAAQAEGDAAARSSAAVVLHRGPRHVAAVLSLPPGTILPADAGAELTLTVDDGAEELEAAATSAADAGATSSADAGATATSSADAGAAAPLPASPHFWTLGKVLAVLAGALVAAAVALWHFGRLKVSL